MMTENPVFVADQDLPCLAESFFGVARILPVPRERISNDSLRQQQAEGLIIRSTTRVDESLLKGSNVRFVATATSGTDHIDRQYLEKESITLLDAAGANARAVVEYCLAVLACYRLQSESADDRFLETGLPRRAGIVGAGNVGGRLANVLASCGVEVLVNDPPLEQANPEALAGRGIRFCGLREVFESDVVSLHVPLVKGGAWPTADMIGLDQVGWLGKGQLLINTCRGEVIQEQALQHLMNGPLVPELAFDVWRNEPGIDSRLLDQCLIGTPHIAGHSVQSKTHAVSMLASKLAECLQVTGVSDPAKESSPKQVRSMGGAPFAALSLICDLLPLARWSKLFKDSVKGLGAEDAFINSRREMGLRSEWLGVTIQETDSGLSGKEQDLLAGLGFRSS